MRVIGKSAVAVACAAAVSGTALRVARAQSCTVSTNCNTQSGSAAAVLGAAGSTTGVEGTSASGTGVVGTSTSGDGVYGSTGSGTFGVSGVYGTSSSASGIGVMGQVTGSSATGVYGYGGKYGVFAYTAMSGGVGVDGHAAGAHGYGVYASCDLDCANDGSPGGVALWAAGNAGGVNAWNSSDARMKKDIKDASYGLEQVLKLRPVTFLWKNEAYGKGTQFGLIAQEVQKVFPELVMMGPDENLALNYVQLVPVLVRAVQQQEVEIAKIESESKTTASSIKTSAAGLFMSVIPLGIFAIWRRRKGGHRESETSESRSL